MNMSTNIQPRPAGELDVEHARAILAACTDLDEVKRIRDQADAIAKYQRSRNAAEDSAVHASAIARRAERRMGEMLAEMPDDQRGRPPKNGHEQGPFSPTLADLGIKKNQSSAWQAIAAVPEEDFEEALAEDIARHRIPSAAKFVRMGRPPRDEEVEGDPDDGTDGDGQETEAESGKAATTTECADEPDNTEPITAPPSGVGSRQTGMSDLDVTLACVRGLNSAERAELYRRLGVIDAMALSSLRSARCGVPEYRMAQDLDARLRGGKPAMGARRYELFALSGGEESLALLGLDYAVTADALAKTYRAAARAAHPDLGGDPDVMARLNYANGVIRHFLETAP